MIFAGKIDLPDGSCDCNRILVTNKNEMLVSAFLIKADLFDTQGGTVNEN